MVQRLQNSRRAGWYCRVLEPGEITAGDQLELVDRPYPEWNLDRLLRVIFERNTPLKEVRECHSLPLPESWNRLLGKRLKAAG